MEEENRASYSRLRILCEKGKTHTDDKDPSALLSEILPHLDSFTPTLHPTLLSIVKSLINRKYHNFHYTVQLNINGFFRKLISYGLTHLSKESPELLVLFSRLLKSKKKFYDNRYTHIPYDVEKEYISNYANSQGLVDPDLSKLNVFYIFNISLFSEHQGFQKIIQLARESTQLQVTAKVILLVSGLFSCFVREKWREIAKRLKEHLVEKIQNLTDEEVRVVQRHDLRMLFSVFEMFFQKLYHSTKAYKVLENCELDLSYRLLSSKYLEKRIIGLSDLTSKINQARNKEKSSFYPSAETSKWLNSVYLAAWIDSHDIIELVFSSNSHPEIVKRAPDLVKFLYTNSRFDRSNISKLWDNAFLKHETDRDALLSLFTDLAYVLKKPDLQHLFSKISILDLHEIDSQILNLLKVLTLQMSKLSKSDNDTEKLDSNCEEACEEESKETFPVISHENFTHSEVMEFLWKICQEESLVSGVSFTISAQTLGILKDSLIFYCKNDRFKFLVKCVENIKKSTSVITSCRLIEDIINSYSEIRSNYDNESKSIIIKTLDKEFDLFSELFKNLLMFKTEAVERAQILVIGSGEKFEESRGDSCYTCSSDDDSQESEERGRRNLDIFKSMRVSKDTELTYLEELKFRLEFIKYLYQTSSESLQVKHAHVLWDAFILNAVTEEEYEILFSWISNPLSSWYSESLMINEELTHYIFTELFLKLDSRFISSGGYSCFERFFVTLNRQHGIITSEYRGELEVKEIGLLGMQYLWQILLLARSEKVFKHCKRFLNRIYKGMKQADDEIMQEFIRNCMDFIGEGVERHRLHPDMDSCTQILRSLTLLADFLEDFERRAANDRIDVVVKNHIQSAFPKEFILSVAPEITLRSLKEMVSSRIAPTFQVSELILFLNSKKLGSKHDSKLINQLGIIANTQINVFEANRDFDNAEEDMHDHLAQLRSIFSCYSDEILMMALEEANNNFDDAVNVMVNEELVSNFQLRYEAQQCVPKAKASQKYSEIISNSHHYFSLLFSLFDMSDEQISNKVWDLLLKIPTNSVIYNNLKLLNDNTWQNILSTTCAHKLLYGLKIIATLLSQHGEETQEWSTNFLRAGCLDHLYRILMNSQKVELVGSGKSSWLCIELLISIVKHFVYEFIIDKKPQALAEQGEGIDNTKLMIKMLEIIENCINKELESTSVIESALDLMVPLIINNSELLSELYSRSSFNCLLSYILDSYKPSVRIALKFTITSIVESIPCPPHGLEPPALYFRSLLLKILPTAAHDHCDEYFELLVKLLSLTKSSEDIELLHSFIEFIQSYEVYESNSSNQEKVFTGYLNLAACVLEANLYINEEVIGYLYRALFETPSNSAIMPPRLKHDITRKSAFNLLLSLSKSHTENSRNLLRLLAANHLSIRLSDCFDSEILSKSSTGFVGLRNFGATCYMNSLIQQLFMIKSFRTKVQQAELVVEDPEEPLTDNLVYQLQDMIWNLEESDKQYYEPKGFCKAFKDYDGQPLNVKQQQDVDEFFNIFCDKIEEILKPTAASKLIRDCFGGIFVHEIESCEAEYPYKGRREEQFYRISLDIKNKKSLEEALDLYIKEDLLDGDNKYLCDLYNCKITAKMRCVIQSLSNTVIIHLKRFEFNYSTMQRTKINDFCEFPMKIDLRPWCTASENPDAYYVYDLVGILVHSGYADAGHYVSIIKDRDSQLWFKFDDRYIEPFDLSRLKEECFGGEIAQNWNSEIMTYSNPRSAYMLVYERSSLIEVKSEELVLNPDLIFMKTFEEIRRRIRKENHEFLRDKLLFDNKYSDFLQEFTENYSVPWVHHVQKELSTTPEISRCTRLQEFFKNKEDLLNCTATSLESMPEVIEIFLEVSEMRESLKNDLKNYLTLFKISTLFSFEMLIRAKQTHTFIIWIKNLTKLYKQNAPACIWLLQYLSDNKTLLAEILLEHRDGEVRYEFKKLLLEACNLACKCEQDYLFECTECLNYKALPYDPEEMKLIRIYKLKYVATTARFFKMYLGYLFRKALTCPKTYNEYFTLIKLFSCSGNTQRHLLVHFNCISRLYFAFLSDYAGALQCNSTSINNDILIKNASSLIQVCATQHMLSTGSYPSTFEKSQNPVILSQQEEESLCSEKSLEKLMMLSKHRDCWDIITHLAWENFTFSCQALSKFATTLFNFKFDQKSYNSILCVGYMLLSLEDSLRYKRIKAFFDCQIYRIHSPSELNTFFQVLLQTKSANSMFFSAVIIWWSDLMNYEHVLTASKENADKFKKIVAEGIGFRFNLSTIFSDHFDHMRSLQVEINKAYARLCELVPLEDEAEPERPNNNNNEFDSQEDDSSTFSDN